MVGAWWESGGGEGNLLVKQDVVECNDEFSVKVVAVRCEVSGELFYCEGGG